MDESLKADVMYWAAFYERRMRAGNKKIFHLEAWVVKVMSLYKVMHTPIYWLRDGRETCWGPDVRMGLRLRETHPPSLRRLADNLHSVSFQHYFIEMGDLDSFE